MAKSGILAGAILSFARALGEFGATIMLAGNIPGKTQTMSTAIYSAVQANDQETAFVWAGIIIVVSLMVMVLMNYWLKQQQKVNSWGEVNGFRSGNKKYYPDFSLDVNFYTEKGILGVLGASGCGKSMTLKCIAGIETPDEGKIILNGRVLFDSEKRLIYHHKSEI